MKSNEDSRARTIWPYIAAILSIVSGGVLGIVAYNQITSYDGLTQAIGYWNAFVTLAYVWLAIRLVLRHEGAYKTGLALSLGNVGFVMAQYYLLSIAAGVAEAQMDDTTMAILIAFLLTDLAVCGGVVASFRDLVVPMRPEDVPESPHLDAALRTTDSMTQENKTLLLDARRRFISYMSTKCRGGIEVNVISLGRPVDLLVKPLFSYIGWLTGPKTGFQQRYAFHVHLEAEDVQNLKRGSLPIIGIVWSATEEAIREATSGINRTTLYLLRDRIWVGSGSTDFRTFSQRELGITFHRPSTAQSGSQMATTSTKPISKVFLVFLILLGLSLFCWVIVVIVVLIRGY